MNLNATYRPKTWDAVVGQKAVVKSLKEMIGGKASQAYLFHGPSGTGKTTLARIAATEFGCDEKSIVEIDAATHTGVDDMRDIQALLRYKPIMGQGTMRAIIIDECHRLSGQAWDSLLKSVEEPPPFVVWFFCTTNFAKVPKTVKTRCAKFELKEVSNSDLEDLVLDIAEEEGLKISDDVLAVIVNEAHGSPREALNNLAVCQKASSRREAADMLKAVLESDATLELCRFLAKGGSWAKCMSIVEKLKDENPEGIRIVATNYFGAAIRNAKTDKDACLWLQRLEAFSTPYNPSEGQAPLMLSIGRVLFGVSS